MSILKKAKKAYGRYQRYKERSMEKDLERSRKNEAYYAQRAKEAKARASYNKNRPPNMFERMADVGNSDAFGAQLSVGGSPQRKTRRKRQQKPYDPFGF